MVPFSPVKRAAWSEEGLVLRFEIEADAFLRGMVRGIVGTLLWVGRGKLSVSGFEEVLRSKDRGQAGPSAPAQGLCLIRVTYDERSGGEATTRKQAETSREEVDE